MAVRISGTRIILYATGLRAGEALRLRCCDLEGRHRLLTIWDSKFFKSRLVPIGTDLCRMLVQYQTDRARLPLAEGDRSVLLTTRTGEAISLARLEHGVDINTIRAWLGHVSLETTNRYAQIDLEMKAKALAACAITGNNRPSDPSAAAARKPHDLMAFLASL